MGDAVAARLNELTDAVLTRMNHAPGWRDAVAAVVEITCRYWPVDHMTRLAKKPADDSTAASDTLESVAVIVAKVREDLEHRYGGSKNVAVAIDKLCHPVVLEVAEIWFSSPEARVAIRSACREAWRIA